MRTAFTMIELIFVIVILGILAAVAIPKLSATRTDALISKTAQDIMSGASEIASYAVSNGKTLSDLSLMSNGIASLVSSGSAVLDTTNKKATIAFGGVSDCVTLQVLTSTTDDNLTLTLKTGITNAKCLGLQSKIDAKKYPMKLRGQYVK